MIKICAKTMELILLGLVVIAVGSYAVRFALQYLSEVIDNLQLIQL